MNGLDKKIKDALAPGLAIQELRERIELLDERINDSNARISALEETLKERADLEWIVNRLAALEKDIRKLKFQIHYEKNS